jgi:hypothetical protein
MPAKLNESSIRAFHKKTTHDAWVVEEKMNGSWNEENTKQTGGFNCVYHPMSLHLN